MATCMPATASHAISATRLPTSRGWSANVPGVYSIKLQPTDGGLRGEMSNQVNANNVDGTNLAFPGYVTEYNSFCYRHGIERELDSGLFTAYAVLCLLSLVPVLNYGIIPIQVVVQLLLAAKICRTINTLPEPMAPAPT